MQFRDYYFRPSLMVALATAVAVVSLVALGVWQWQRADLNQSLQEFKELRAKQPPTEIGAAPLDAVELQGRKVRVRGVYETQHQFFLDNQIYGGADALPGYHVITPLHVAGSEMRVLVNRGWIRMGHDRSRLPQIETPQGELEIIGFTVTPDKPYLLKPQQALKPGEWEPIWQAIDIPRFAAAMDFPLQPVVIQLDPDSPAGGFVRDWQRPSVQAKRNVGYSIQWFATALTVLVLFVAMNLKKIPDEGKMESERQ